MTQNLISPRRFTGQKNSSKKSKILAMNVLFVNNEYKV